MLHKDFPESSKNGKLSVIVPLSGAAKVKVWEEGVGPKYVELEIGDVLVLGSACIHAGCAYEKTNYRLHFYLSTIGESWVQGETQPIDIDALYASVSGSASTYCNEVQTCVSCNIFATAGTRVAVKQHAPLVCFVIDVYRYTSSS